MVRKVNGTNGPWYEWSTRGTNSQWYEKSRHRTDRRTSRHLTAVIRTAVTAGCFDKTPQAAYLCCSGAFVTDTAGVQPVGRKLSLRPQTLTCEQTAIRSMVRRLIVSTLVIHVIIWIAAHLPTPEG